MIIINHGKPELLLSRGAYLLAFYTRIWGNSGFGFPRVQACVQSMFSGLTFSNDKYFSTLATYHPPDFLSNLLLYTKELIHCPVYRLD